MTEAPIQDSRMLDRGRWLLRLIWVRVAVFSVFVAARPTEDTLVLLAAVYALSFCWYGLRRLNTSYIGQAYAQIGVDLLLITWLVNRTGGLDSYFSSLYFLEIVMSSVLLERRGAYVTAAAASLLHGVHVSLANFGAIPSTTVGFPDAATLRYILAVTTFGFCAVGFLANALAERWRHSLAAMNESSGRAAFLQALTVHIVDSLGSGLITTDPAGRIYLFNPAAARISGHTSDRAVGRSIHDLFPSLPEKTGAGEVEIAFRGPDRKERRVQFSVTPLMMSSDRPIGYVWRFDDVTDLRAMEGELRRRDRMASIGMMSAGIAHEIRNPLASISGSFALLRSGLRLTEEQRQLTRIIARETDRLHDTINDFLLYARPPAPRLQRVRLDRLIAESIQLMRNNPSLGPAHVLEDELEPVEAPVDENMMRQVFHNLASNALKAMPGAGRLRISLRAEAGRAEIRFEDSGVGLTPEQIEVLFVPFHSSFRTGTGLGLSIVYQIVQSHQGTISVRSTPGAGSTFIVELPLVEKGGRRTDVRGRALERDTLRPGVMPAPGAPAGI